MRRGRRGSRGRCEFWRERMLVWGFTDFMIVKRITECVVEFK